MPLNIYAKRTSRSSDAHDRMVADLLNELTAWDPREWITAVKRWHRGPLGAVTLVHLNVIAELEVRGPLSMGHLADALGVSVASATGIVSRMEDRRLVERRHGGPDRRVVMVHPTAKGAGIFRALEVRRRGRLAKLLEHLTEDEMAGFIVGLRALRQARARETGATEGETEAASDKSSEATAAASGDKAVDP